MSCAARSTRRILALLRALIKTTDDRASVNQNVGILLGLTPLSLGREDSNLRIRGPKPRALPLGHAPVL